MSRFAPNETARSLEAELQAALALAKSLPPTVTRHDGSVFADISEGQDFAIKRVKRALKALEAYSNADMSARAELLGEVTGTGL